MCTNPQVENVESVDNFADKYYLKPAKMQKISINSGFSRISVSNYVDYVMHKKIHMLHRIKMCISMWIMWITYLPRRCSPIFTTSPAPIVINRSPCVQLFKRKLSISSKVGK